MWILSFVTGAIAWSLTEYILHRFAGHRKTGLAFSQDHLQHHRDPKYFLATGQKLKRGITVFLVLSSVSSLLVGALAGVAFGLGFMMAYGYYEWIHWAIHARPPKNAYGRWARKHHLYHHFGNMRVNHGVTSPLWDMVFGTYVPAEVVKIPSKKADSWITGAIDAAVPARWVDDYQLIRARG